MYIFRQASQRVEYQLQDVCSMACGLVFGCVVNYNTDIETLYKKTETERLE